MGLKFKTHTTGKRTVIYRPITLDFSMIWQIIAFLISWATYKSVGWAIVHTIFGLWYIVYWAITGENATEVGVNEIINYWKSVF